MGEGISCTHGHFQLGNMSNVGPKSKQYMRLAYHLYIKVVEFYKVKLHYDGDGESFTMYKWGIMYMMYFFKNYSLEHNKTKECENLIFGDDLKF